MACLFLSVRGLYRKVPVAGLPATCLYMKYMWQAIEIDSVAISRVTPYYIRPNTTKILPCTKFQATKNKLELFNDLY